jgi:hypothetical protein
LPPQPPQSACVAALGAYSRSSGQRIPRKAGAAHGGAPGVAMGAGRGEKCGAKKGLTRASARRIIKIKDCRFCDGGLFYNFTNCITEPSS